MSQTGEGSGTALDSLAYLYDRYGARVYGYAMALLSNASDAEETVQEAFTKLYARMKGGWKPDQPENYLFRAVRNEAYSRLRRRRLFFLRTRQWADGSHWLAPPSGGAGARDGELEAVEAELAALPVKQREIVVLKVFEAMTFEEIGKVLHISPNTAASRYRYAVDKLRSTLKREDFAP
ncbi:MAG: sigma-70 family RNA polymerase sigma factor [Candidatus Hydrogenedentes bacterium]|nr:sigma-70 family RNA polymerase sigma factor [Candidatus Hydrogenedentota bacterium]